MGRVAIAAALMAFAALSAEAGTIKLYEAENAFARGAAAVLGPAASKASRSAGVARAAARKTAPKFKQYIPASILAAAQERKRERAAGFVVMDNGVSDFNAGRESAVASTVMILYSDSETGFTSAFKQMGGQSPFGRSAMNLDR